MTTKNYNRDFALQKSYLIMDYLRLASFDVIGGLLGVATLDGVAKLETELRPGVWLKLETELLPL